jgi:hypothetical protein
MCGFWMTAERPDAGCDLERLEGSNGHDRQCAAGTGQGQLIAL